MPYRQIYRVDSPIPQHPRWVRNESDNDVDVTYNSNLYTIAAGETIYTDMAVAAIFLNQCRQYEFDKESGAIRGEKPNLLKEYTTDPSLVVVDDPRMNKVSVKQTIEIEDVSEDVPATDKLSTMKMPDLRKMASLLGLSVDIKTKKVDLVELIRQAQK